MKLFLNSVVLILIMSCSSNGNSNLKSRELDDYYVATGVSKYFLTDLPDWANFVSSAKCFKQTRLRYFDVEALMKSFGLTYNQALQLQSTFNEEFTIFKIKNEKHLVTTKEEEQLFYKVSEKVNSKILFFDPPTFKKINLIMLDEILNDKKAEQKLKQFLNSKVMDTGVPVLVSFCLTRSEVENKFPDLNAKMITAELFSIYDKTGNKTPGFKIELDQFFTEDQKLNLYSQKKLFSSDEIKGTFKLLNY